MEQKQVVMSALSAGIGIGLGVGFLTAQSQTFRKWTSHGLSINYQELMELELTQQVIDGKSSDVTFDRFPYYISEQTRELLTSAAFVRLKRFQFTQYIRKLSPASSAILLSGPAEPCHQMLAKALAHHFDTKLLLLDATDFSLKLQRKHRGSTNSHDSKSLFGASIEHMTNFLESFSILPSSWAELKKLSSGNLWQQNSGHESKSSASGGTDNLQCSRSGSASEADLSRLVSNMINSPKQAPLKHSKSWAFDVKLLVESLYKVLDSISRTSPVILYLRDVDRLLFRAPETYSLINKMIKRLSGPVLILGSRMLDSWDRQSYGETDKKLSLMFPYNIDIKPPRDDAHLLSWKSKLEEDMKAIQLQDSKNHLTEVLEAIKVECDDLSSITFSDTLLLNNYIQEIVVSAISHHLLSTEEPNCQNGWLIISSKSLAHGLSIFQAGHIATASNDTLQTELESQESTIGSVAAKTKAPATEVKPEVEIIDSASKGDTPKKEVDTPKEENPPPAASKPDVAPDNDFEKRIRSEVIPAGEIGVTFADIGALENIKDALQELVMLPLQRPDLFKGELLKPCKGILLFGPPGTGKTMLAKAIATEANASFINVSMSTITSKWFGEDEKNVRALFSLAAKVSPTVIFIDEVDSMLGQRSRAGEHEAMRKIKNEFMAHWDGLLSKSEERVLVLAATNRPFDLDEAIIRRFQRRIMVGLPTTENREKILRTLLAKENLEKGFDFQKLATMTEGYTGSDLKNVCTTAAFRPVRELIKKERQKDKANDENVEKTRKVEKESDSSQQPKASSKDGAEVTEDTTEENTLRPITMEDMRQAMSQICPSFASEGAGMNELKEWNELYGEGGSRRKQHPTYFL